MRDSKQLTPKRRQSFFKKIIEISAGHKIISIHAQEIDSRASVGLNINELEALKVAHILDELNPDVAYIDSPTSPDPKKFEKMIRKNLKNQNIDIHCEWKCDSNHIECSAASILAKVTRDVEVDKIRKAIGMDFGSGYPADPITMKFVKEHWENRLSKYIRHSWGTIKDLEKMKGQKTLGEFD